MRFGLETYALCPPPPNMMQARELLQIRWRQDRLPLLVMLLAFVLMTWPFVLHMHDTLPVNNDDTHTALWQNWWLREALTQGWDINHSHLLFHPTGLDVSLQPRRWTSFPLWTALYSLLGDPLAFNLVAALGMLFKCYGMYLVGLLVFRRRLPALCAALYYVFNSYSLRLALESPNSGASEWIAWFMLFFMLGLRQLRGGRALADRSALYVAGGAVLCAEPVHEPEIDDSGNSAGWRLCTVVHAAAGSLAQARSLAGVAAL